jgi:hypothetical protein
MDFDRSRFTGRQRKAGIARGALRDLVMSGLARGRIGYLVTPWTMVYVTRGRRRA